jgi:trk system potassium uptake protein TrkH
MKLFEKSDTFYFLMFFFVLISVGALLLLIPGVWQGNAEMPDTIRFTDAYFFATSAVCNAGLSTVDLADFSRTGQIIVIFLMQFGGLGIISFSCLLLMIPGNRLSISRRNAIQNFYLDDIEYRPRMIVRNILIFTFIFEILGVIVFTFLFYRAGVEEPFFMAIFHAISAFCNTGISAFPDQLRRFCTDIPVLITVMTLIVLGGIGFIVLHDVIRVLGGRIRGQRVRLRYHSRVVLAMTAIIDLIGILFFFIAEHQGLYKDLNLGAALTNALFQTVNPRSGGFDVLSQRALSQPSKLFTCILMLSGGAPGSIAGGIKLTTLFVIFATILQKPDKEGDITLFHHRLTRNTIHTAIVYVLKALSLLTCFIGALAIVEGLHGKSVGPIVFETFSAFGTVGLSLGITSDLSTVGKWVIIAAMFAGRVGLIALAFPSIYKYYEIDYPEGSLLLG